jgi:hypothetical protein
MSLEEAAHISDAESSSRPFKKGEDIGPEMRLQVALMKEAFGENAPTLWFDGDSGKKPNEIFREYIKNNGVPSIDLTNRDALKEFLTGTLNINPEDYLH